MSTAFLGAGIDVAPNGNGHAAAEPVAPSALADIESELLAEVVQRTVTLAVPARSGWSVRYLAEISSAELNEWRRRAKNDKAPGGLDAAVFGPLVLASKCRALTRNGVDVAESAEDATPRTFQSSSMKVLYGVARPVDVVLALYGGHDHDADIGAVVEEVLRTAGWGADGAELASDPTQAPSGA